MPEKGLIDLVKFVHLCRGKGKISLNREEIKAVRKGRSILEKLIESGRRSKLCYSINTGVGALYSRRIPENKIKEFQKNLIMSHACGIGPPLEKEIVRGIMLQMISDLKKGYSGIRLETLETLIKMFNENILPVVPEKGSLGASGDLVPRAHVALSLIGEGEVLHNGIAHGLYGDRCCTMDAFNYCGINPLKLEAGEGIALLNGTSLMASIMGITVYHVRNLIPIAHAAAAMSMAALRCDTHSFKTDSQEPTCRARSFSACFLDKLLSPAGKSPRLQDPYSMRCAPRIFGCFLDTFYSNVQAVVLNEMERFSGNPEIFLKTGKIEQGRDNFHGQSLAQAADTLSIALASLTNISEARVSHLVNHRLRELPIFLVRNAGLNTGLMIVHYADASLAAENRFLANPASVHSISVAGGQEDFVSMGALAARKAWESCKNTQYAVAIEILCAAQALDFLKKPMPPNIEKIHKIIRGLVPHIDRDRIFSEDIKKIYNFIHDHGDDFAKDIEEILDIPFKPETRMLYGD